MDNLTGKVAVVTGAASGMGLAFAHRFARAGMKVVLSDIEKPVLDTAVAEVQATGAEAIGLVTDVSSAAAVDSLRDAAIDAFGRVNIVCNNAGVAGASGLFPEAIDLNDWQWVMAVNFWGVVHGHNSFLPHLLSHGDGHIVNTASMAGHMPGHSAYAASKFAVVAITEGLHNRLKATGSSVGVSCLCPGWVSTRIAESTRNRPEWAAPVGDEQPHTAQFEAGLAIVADLVRGGRPPAEVADLVHDAVLENRFWIFTTEEFSPVLALRHREIEKGENPSAWQRRLI